MLQSIQHLLIKKPFILKTANLLLLVALQGALSVGTSLRSIDVPFSVPRNDIHHEELWAYSIKLLRKYIDDDCAAKLTDIGLTIPPSAESLD